MSKVLLASSRQGAMSRAALAAGRFSVKCVLDKHVGGCS